MEAIHILKSIREKNRTFIFHSLKGNKPSTIFITIQTSIFLNIKMLHV